MRHALALLLCLAACSHAGGPELEADLALGDLGSSDQRGAPAGDLAADPIVAAPGTWTWVDVAGSFCDDGSPTGIGVNLGDADKLLVVFNGGGACGDYTTCVQLGTTTHGPFGATEFNAAGLPAGSVFDRAAPGNPFAAYTMVFVPYCTGDVHGGTQVVAYTGASGTTMFHHVGHTNALRALDRIAATWPTLSRLVVTGASAGGYGALFNYDSFRARWPMAKGYLLDDSGPVLLDADTHALLKGWFVTWGLIEWSLGRCSACTTTMSPIYAALAAAYPGDRMALLSTTQDKTIRAFHLLSGPAFETALFALAAQLLDPLATFRRYFVAGSGHTMLGHPGDFSAGPGLWSWLAQMVGDDPAWTTVTP